MPMSVGKIHKLCRVECLEWHQIYSEIDKNLHFFFMCKVEEGLSKDFNGISMSHENKRSKKSENKVD